MYTSASFLLEISPCFDTCSARLRRAAPPSGRGRCTIYNNKKSICCLHRANGCSLLYIIVTSGHPVSADLARDGHQRRTVQISIRHTGDKVGGTGAKGGQADAGPAGQTAIAIDTILNQKGKDVICIYVAIGQKQSTVANVVDTLSKHGAMDYSIVVSATASEMAPLQYIAPYAGVAMAEYFMLQGKDVLCVYDDLSKHAVAYRTMSLLLQRPTGREAYPGDVFYLHSRLLERACCLNKDYGGGSITALPIIETQAGDVSAYIPTNVISITDGQIFLESELFFSGVRPAVNPGISVSRVGGSAQIKAMKKVSGSLKLLYSQYRELQSFSQFGSDLDKDTKERLAQGERIVEVLKQGKTSPLDVEKQVVIIYAVVNNYLKNIRVEDIAEFEKDLFVYIDETHPDIFSSIRETGELTKENEQAIKDVLAEYSQKFLQSR